jgi:hypothetical protein
MTIFVVVSHDIVMNFRRYQPKFVKKKSICMQHAASSLCDPLRCMLNSNLN